MRLSLQVGHAVFEYMPIPFDSKRIGLILKIFKCKLLGLEKPFKLP